MFTTKNWVQLTLILAAFVIFIPRGAAQTFSCSSDDGKRHYCPAQGPAQLVKQRSDSPCRQGYSWGTDKRGVWVDHGCRADFAAVRRRLQRQSIWRARSGSVVLLGRYAPALLPS